MCLRWLYEKSIIIIPKTTSEARLAENMGVFDWELSEEQHARIDGIEETKRLIAPDFAEF